MLTSLCCARRFEQRIVSEVQHVQKFSRSNLLEDAYLLLPDHSALFPAAAQPRQYFLTQLCRAASAYLSTPTIGSDFLSLLDASESALSSPPADAAVASSSAATLAAAPRSTAEGRSAVPLKEPANQVSS